MNRYTCYLGIFFLGLLVFSGLLQSIIYILLDTRAYFQLSFLSWYSLAEIIYLAGALILLRYYYYRKYWLAFSTCVVLTIASLLHFFVVYSILLSKQTSDYYESVNVVYLVAGIAYTASLALSTTRKRFWLKIAGISGTIVGIVMLTTFVWFINDTGVPSKEFSTAVFKWTQLASAMLPALFIMNFLSELKSLKSEKVNTDVPEWVKGFMVTAVLLTLFPLLFLTLSLVRETFAAFGIRPLTPRAMVLARQFESRTYRNSQGDSLPYRLLIPLDYDSTKKYPLVVCLHHGGAHGADNIRQIEGSEPAQLLYAKRRQYPAFLFVPQCSS